MSQAGKLAEGSPTIPGIETLTGNTGGAVPGSGVPVNVNIVGSGNVTVTGNPGTSTLTITTNSGRTISYTAVTHAQSPYTVLTTDEYLGVNVTAGVVSILLPNAPSTGRVFVVKDNAGLSNTSNITVTTVGGVVTIDGAASYTMNTNYYSIQLIFNGSSYEIF